MQGPRLSIRVSLYFSSFNVGCPCLKECLGLVYEKNCMSLTENLEGP